MKTGPIEIKGNWRRGWTLDLHVVQSLYLGDDEFGHPRFDTKRSEVGELLFQLKYHGQDNVDKIATLMAGFFNDKPNTLGCIELVVPVLPSTDRKVQPVFQVAEVIARRLGKTFSLDAVRKTKATPGLKNIDDPGERQELLDGAFEADGAQVRDKGVLLIDDLYRSGATANAVTVALINAGARRVYFIAATRTRGT